MHQFKDPILRFVLGDLASPSEKWRKRTALVLSRADVFFMPHQHFIWLSKINYIRYKVNRIHVQANSSVLHNQNKANSSVIHWKQWYYKCWLRLAENNHCLGHELGLQRLKSKKISILSSAISKEL